MPRTVVSWFGLRGEIMVENNLWHLVRVNGIPLPHPPLMNLMLRRGIPQAARLELSFLHEFGHLQTLPLAALQLLLLVWVAGRSSPGNPSLLRKALLVALGHSAFWELLSESYVMAAAGKTYRQIYGQHPNRGGRAAFWGSMVGLLSLSAWALLRGARPCARTGSQRNHEARYEASLPPKRLHG